MYQFISTVVSKVPVAYAAGAGLLLVMAIAGCDAAYGGDCSLGLNGGCQVQQFNAGHHQQQIVVRQFVQPQRVIVRQQVVQQHHHNAQAVIVERLQVQKPQRQVVRQRIVTRSRR